jgi:hypothetical protein
LFTSKKLDLIGVFLIIIVLTLKRVKMNKKECKEIKELAQKIVQTCLKKQFIYFSDKAFSAALHNNFKKELLYLMLAMETAEKIIDNRKFL